jgi:endonuclease YncB( thermonuclease family)
LKERAMKAKPFLPVAVLCAAAFALVPRAAPATRASVPLSYPPAFPARVVELMDGDSFKVTCDAGTVEVRLFDVNCPEFDDRGGDRAKSITRQTTLGRRVWVFPSGKRPKDAHGRLLARVWTPKGWLSDVLLRMGAAQRYADPDKPSAGPARKPKAQAPSKPQDRDAEPSARKAKSGAQSNALVHITKTGSKYHRAECPHLRHGSIAIPLSEAKDRGLEPCAHCQPPQ